MDETEEFFDAVKRGDHDTVERMLRNDNQLAQSRDEEDATALHHAALKMHRKIVDLLLKNGADINARDNKNDTGTPAGWAIHPLREQGGLLAIEIDDLRFAIERGDVVWVERFLTRHPALARAVDRDGTPLADYARTNPALARIFAKHSAGSKR